MKNNDIVQEWFGLYHQDILQYLVYCTGRLDVEDLVQETFIKALQHLSSFRHESEPKTWLFTIARRLAQDERRRGIWKALLPDFLLATMKSSDPAPHEKLMLNEEKTALYEAVNKLRPGYREIIILRGIMDLTSEEAADILGCSTAKVHLTYHRALQSLKKHMIAEKGGVVDEAANG
ncbi:RNA polymerase sigma factor [Fictibacillus aquaticus]|uniref:RNA polymerase sigma factor n=1 Tax=Fictibacillus aquaticus TaxID=2021314 RepID=A0A235F504_9BACL|nr:RNA polymerase sigma factor [Fictibacillus aquaticus]OYD56330.1 hypothetical protein CGZ90_17970 [Fictibacillus aquaticus]